MKTHSWWTNVNRMRGYMLPSILVSQLLEDYRKAEEKIAEQARRIEELSK